MNFLLGKGFIGTALLEKIDAVHIPHQQIDTFEPQPFDKLFYFCAYGNAYGATNDDLIIKANLLDLITVFNKVKDFNFKSFVYLSTSSVKLPVQTTYSRSKKAAEEILMSYVEKYHLPIAIIRPYSVTGKGEQEFHLIPTLLKAAITDDTVNLCPGTHDFIDVADLVDGILNLSDNNAKGIYELGTGFKTTNDDVVNLVEMVTGKRLRINRVEQLRKYDSPNWVCSNFKARSWGWLPLISLKESIEQEYAHLREKSPTDQL